MHSEQRFRKASSVARENFFDPQDSRRREIAYARARRLAITPASAGQASSLALLRYCPGLQVARLAAASRSASALISPPSSTAIPVR